MADVEVKLEDYTVEVINALDSAIEQYLLEASSEIGSQAARNTRVSTGKLKGSWTSEVDAEAATATVGVQKRMRSGKNLVLASMRRKGMDAKADGIFMRVCWMKKLNPR